MMKQLVIMRGLPGSGKSFLGHKLCNEAQVADKEVCSTDDYFMHNGEYKFDGKRLGAAHDWNKTRVQRLIDHGYEFIVVDNTNTQYWELLPYVEMALNAGYEVQLREPQTEWAWNALECFNRNTHNVPLEAINRMIARWQDTQSVLLDIVDHYGKGGGQDIIVEAMACRIRRKT